ncbi:10956_t:CDS:2, partial [Gigaspora rosea]
KMERERNRQKKKTSKADILKAKAANLKTKTQEKERKHTDRSKTGIKNNSVYSKKWNPKHEEVISSTNKETEETVEIKLMGGFPTLLKVATGVNKGFCETKVSQAQTMSQNKKGQYSTIEIE